jgi:exodeoxyribonuclease VII large subunit
VGHEVDFSISDFVADARAATPTQAPVIATPNINEVRMFADDLTTRLHDIVEQRVTDQKERIQQLVQSHALQVVQQKVSSNHEKVNNLLDRLRHRREVHFMKKHEKLNELSHRLELKNPNAALEQGYSRIWQDDEWIRSVDAFDADKEATIEWGDGKETVNK